MKETFQKIIENSLAYRMIIQECPQREKYYIDELTGKAVKFSDVIPTDAANFGKGYLEMAKNRATANKAGFRYEMFTAGDYELFNNLYYTLMEAKCKR